MATPVTETTLVAAIVHMDQNRAARIAVLALCAQFLLGPGAAGAAEPLPADPPPAAAATPVDAADMPAAEATDAGPEQILLAQLEAGRLDDSYRAFESTSGSFLVRFVDATRPPVRGAVVLLPATTQRITSLVLVDALLEEFAENDWAVLAVQRPLLDSNADLEDYAASAPALDERLAAACAQLTADGFDTIVLLALDDAAPLAHNFVARDPAGGAIRGIASSGWWPATADLADRPQLELVDDGATAALEAAGKRHKSAQRTAQAHRLDRLPGAIDTIVGATTAARRLRGWVTTTLADAPAR